jgi:Bacterial membrane protein YfhO
MARAAARPALAAAILYALLALVFVGQGLLPERTLSPSDSLWSAAPWTDSRPADAPPLGSNFELADASEVFVPYLQWTREHLLDVPLWNPHIMGGRPYVGNAQSAVFSPFSAPSYVLPFWDSLAVVAALKLFLAAFGTFLLCRALGMRFGGALAAGTVFAFGTFFVVWLAWPLTSIFALVPWLLLLAELLLRRPGPLPFAGLAALVALQFFGGHPESSFHAMFVLVAFFALRLGLRRRDGREPLRALVRPALAFAGALVTGAAVAAVALGPFVELLLHSGDLARRLDDEPGHWPHKYLGALFLHDYWGRPTQDSTIDPFMAVRGWYAGAATLMLATAALVLRPTRERVAVAIFGVFCAAMVIGVAPIFDLVTLLPGFSAAHNQRLLIYVLLGLALLAGWGLDDLSARELPSPRRRRLVLAAAGVLALVPVAWMALAGTLVPGRLGDALEVAWGFADPPPVVRPAPSAAATDTVRMSALLQWLPLAALGLALIALRLRPDRRLPAAAFAALAVALLAGDLFRANMGFNPAIPERNAVQPVTPAVDYLQSRRPARFVGVGPGTVYQPLPSDLAMTYDLYDARGYDYPVEKRFDRLWRRNVAPAVLSITQPVEYAFATPAALRALSLLSVRDLLQEPGADPPRAPGLRLAYSGPDADVYANENALPRVFLVGSQRVVGGEDEALRAVTAPGFDGRRVAVTEEPVEGLPRAGGDARPAGRARLVSYENERVVVEAAASRRSLLVLTDVHFPGWQVSVNGRDEPLRRVDYLLRGVALPAGTHRVEFEYRPGSWLASRIVTGLGLLVLAAALVAGLRGRRR